MRQWRGCGGASREAFKVGFGLVARGSNPGRGKKFIYSTSVLQFSGHRSFFGE